MRRRAVPRPAVRGLLRRPRFAYTAAVPIGLHSARRLSHRRQLFHFSGLPFDAAGHDGRGRQRDSRVVWFRAFSCRICSTRVRPERIRRGLRPKPAQRDFRFRNGIFPAYKANREARRSIWSGKFAHCRILPSHGLAEFASGHITRPMTSSVPWRRAHAPRDCATSSSRATRIYRN